MNSKKRKIYRYTDKSKFYYRLSEPLDSMDITPDGSTIISITRSGVVSFWSTSTGRLESILTKKYDYSFPHKRYKKQHEIVVSSDSSFALVFNALLGEIVRVDIPNRKIESVVKTKIFHAHYYSCGYLIQAIAISPKDDTFLVAFDEKIVISNMKKYALVEKLIWDDNSVNVLSYNSKGFYFIAGSVEGNIVLYTKQPLKKIWSIENAHSGAVTALMFTKNTEKIVSAGDDGEVKVWDFHTGRYLHNIYETEQKIKDLAFSEDESYLVVTLEDGVVILMMNELEVTSIASLELKREDRVLFTRLTHEQIVIYTKLNGLQMYNIKSTKLLKEFTKSIYSNQNLTHVRLGCGHGGFLKRPPLNISLDSRYLLSVLTTQQIALWDMREVELIGTFGEGKKSVSAVTITADNRYLFSASSNYVHETMTETSIEMYEVESSMLLYSFEIDKEYVSVVSMRVTPDGRYLVAILSGGMVMRWDIESLELVESRGISCHEYDIYAPTMSWDGSLVMYALDRDRSWNRKISSIEIVDIATGNRLENIEYHINEHSHKFLTIEISTDNRYVTLYSNNLKLFCWDREERVFLYKSKTQYLSDENYYDDMIRSVVAPNGKYRVNIYVDEKKGLSIWNLEEEELYRLFVAENDNALIIDMEESKAMVDGGDEVLLQIDKEVKMGKYLRVDFE